ncbi:cupin domain-containing protein [Bradyrhizobium sp. AS23.2]|uniref:cupin domain-containing protein n=1 Tax=Bradyrhizobium sp. AS23.2 TaxID=1680155 RepID=UPI00093C3578|nr:cupin domain-containing protein [Bradyrhizobium sp. AS23.2]OKO72072.1 cupin [Bradyrhizobium sp. AS23.2]
MLKKTLLALAFTSLAFATSAQQPGIKRTPLQKIDFPEGYTTVTAIAEVPPGGAAGRHTHPGVETGYVLEGEVDLLIDGQPAKLLKAGDSYEIPAGVVHDAKTHGDKSLKIIGIYIFDKTKPLASPAP